jgi:mxaJ protein
MEGGFDEFVHSTLAAHRCDVIIDVPYGMANVATTRPYYIGSYVFVFKRSAGYDVKSMDSPVLRKLKIGYEADTPAEGGLKLRALTPGNVPFEIADHPGESPDVMLNAIDRGRINVGITWEPAIGYFLLTRPGYTVVPVPNSRSQGSPEQYTFPMAMATRSDDRDLNAQLDKAVAQHKAEFASILRGYGVHFFQPETGT